MLAGEVAQCAAGAGSILSPAIGSRKRPHATPMNRRHRVVRIRGKCFSEARNRGRGVFTVLHVGGICSAP